MKRHFLLPLVILSFVFTACSVDDTPSNEDSFDPDGIANVNNGGGVDFSQYENVWEYAADVSSEDENEFMTNGIVNSPYIRTVNNQQEYILLVTKDCKFNYRFVNDEYPSYFHWNMETGEIELGTFSLYKDKLGNFCIKIIIDKTSDGDGNKIKLNKAKTIIYKYIVTERFLYLYE